MRARNHSQNLERRLAGNTGATRLLWGVLTAGINMLDTITYCKCCSCGRTKQI